MHVGFRGLRWKRVAAFPRAPWLLLLVGCSAAPEAAPPSQTGEPAAPGEERPPASAPGSEGAPSDVAEDVAGVARGEPGVGSVIVAMSDGSFRRVRASSAPLSENVSARLDSLSSGKDDAMVMSRDGSLLVVSTRFGCEAAPCLSVVDAELRSGTPVVAGGELVTDAQGRPALGSGAQALVYASSGGPHRLDLWIVRRQAAAWSRRTLLTAASSASHHHDPQISPDGTRVAFDCGPDAYGGRGTSVCEVHTDGNGFRVVASPQDRAGGSAAHHPSYDPNGSIVFEGDWDGEQIWRARGSTAAAIAPRFSNDNSPCVLPDGRIASLWLGRPGNPRGQHELKIMNPDGSADFMALTGIDIVDVGLSCGR